MNNKHFNLYFVYIIHAVKYAYIIHLVHSSSVPKVDTTGSENHISEQDPNILTLMVSHYDCAKQNNLRQFSLLNVEPCKQAPSDIQHTKTQQLVKATQYKNSPLSRTLKIPKKYSKFLTHNQFQV